MSNLRYVTLDTLIKIRENGYESKFYKGRFYDKEEVEREIKRKLESKGYRGFTRIRKS